MRSSVYLAGVAAAFFSRYAHACGCFTATIIRYPQNCPEVSCNAFFTSRIPGKDPACPYTPTITSNVPCPTAGDCSTKWDTTMMKTSTCLPGDGGSDLPPPSEVPPVSTSTRPTSTRPPTQPPTTQSSSTRPTVIVTSYTTVRPTTVITTSSTGDRPTATVTVTTITRTTVFTSTIVYTSTSTRAIPTSSNPDAGACKAEPTSQNLYMVPLGNAATFTGSAAIASVANGVEPPDGWTEAFKNLKAASAAQKYISFTIIPQYDPRICSQVCDMVQGCISFNIYFERDPTVKPGPGCENPPATANIKCSFFGVEIDKKTATNTGQWRSSFQVVIAGSNGYYKGD